MLVPVFLLAIITATLSFVDYLPGVSYSIKILLKISTSPVDNHMSSKKKKKKAFWFINITESQPFRKTRQGCKCEASEFAVRTTTIDDLRKQKEEFLKFHAERDEQKCMKNRKSLHRAKNDLYHLSME